MSHDDRTISSTSSISILIEKQAQVRREAWAALFPVVGDVPSLECAFLAEPTIAAPWQARLDAIRWAMVQAVEHVVRKVVAEMARKYRVEREDLETPAMLGCYTAAIKLDMGRKNSSYETLCFWWARRNVREAIRSSSHPCSISRRIKVRAVSTVDVHDGRQARRLAAPNDRPDHRILATEENMIRLENVPRGVQVLVRELQVGASVAEVARGAGLKPRAVLHLLQEAAERASKRDSRASG